MQTISIGVSSLKASRLAYGCWRIAGTSDKSAAENETNGRAAVRAAFDAGYTFFDNANIYGRGEAERILGDVVRDTPGMRDQIVVTTKCGVRHAGDPEPSSPHRWDFSGDYIVEQCEASLKRLRMEAIDIFMLHRPDYLADPQEIASAFTRLRDAGKVRWFGVSNFRPTLVTALQVVCPMPLIVHQVEISLARLNVFDDGTLDQCLVEKITPMAWSPLAGGLIGGGARRLLSWQKQYQPDKFLPVLEEVASARGVSRTVIALAWLLRHPSGIVPIVGSNNPERIRDAARAVEITLTREEWYRLLTAARGEPLP
ncbi:MAG TPA: aldo/keto reductase [Verrucomicrobiae bacterium]|nr:aldo/keto reductase [Verrucomicrobiae bacterium]